MLKILGGLFAARQRGVEDGAAPPTGFLALADLCNGLGEQLQAGAIDPGHVGAP